jgi:hypothetical protein
MKTLEIDSPVRMTIILITNFHNQYPQFPSTHFLRLVADSFTPLRVFEALLALTGSFLIPFAFVGVTGALDRTPPAAYTLSKKD